MQNAPNPFEQIYQRLSYLENKLAALDKTTSPNDPQPEVFDIDGLINHLGNVSKATVYRWMHFRTIPYFKIGRRVYFKRAEIDNWMLNHRHKTIAETVDGLMKR